MMLYPLRVPHESDEIGFVAWKYGKQALNSLDSNMPDQAIYLAEIACAMTPEVVHFHRIAACAYWQKRDFTKCKEHYLKVVQLEPDDKEARKRLGIAMAQLREFDEAIKQFKVCAESGPDSKLAKYYIFNALVDSGNWINAYNAHKTSIAAYQATPPSTQKNLLYSIKDTVIDLTSFMRTLFKRIRRGHHWV